MNKLIFIVACFISSSSFAVECSDIESLLKKAVILSNKLKVVSCNKTTKNNQTILSGIYSTPLTVRTGNHIPYSAVYKDNNLKHIMFFNDPSDIIKAEEVNK